MKKVKVKDQKKEPEADKFILQEDEFNYLMNLQTSSRNSQYEFNRIISGFLYFIAIGRLGYDSGGDLKFELDFDNEKHELKIWKVQEDLFNATAE